LIGYDAGGAKNGRKVLHGRKREWSNHSENAKTQVQAVGRQKQGYDQAGAAKKHEGF
jgi:hypothetical protein